MLPGAAGPMGLRKVDFWQFGDITNIVGALGEIGADEASEIRPPPPLLYFGAAVLPCTRCNEMVRDDLFCGERCRQSVVRRKVGNQISMLLSVCA